jgi:rhodanese-related sulfurtransferase
MCKFFVIGNTFDIIKMDYHERVKKMTEIKTITTDELNKKLQNGEDLLLVDVREDEEVEEGMIPGARHIKMGDIPESLDKFEKNKEYIFICRSGNRSGNVAHYMQEQGYKVVNMEGGMMNWGGETAPKK